MSSHAHAPGSGETFKDCASHGAVDSAERNDDRTFHVDIVSDKDPDDHTAFGHVGEETVGEELKNHAQRDKT